MTIQDTIEQLMAYKGPDKLTLHEGADEFLFVKIEMAFNIKLPDDFKELYRFTDGFDAEEDMFTLIALEDILYNKNRDDANPLSIAEYMIYCDDWQLEINPDDCNDYKIIVERDYNKLMLTNSLAEFISRFLKGGVVDTEGLYDWADEMEKLPIYSTKLKTAESLLSVFYHGLKYDLISKQEVIDWADIIIMHENEPEFLFMELSLCRDKNEMMGLLHPIVVEGNDTVARATLGILYHRLSSGVIPLITAITVMDQHSLYSQLTPFEIEHICEFTDTLWIDNLTISEEKIKHNLLDFLDNYKALELSNYKQWYGNSYTINYRISNEQKLASDRHRSTHVTYKKQLRISLRMIYWTGYTLALISFISIITSYNDVQNNVPLGKFRSDLFQCSLLYAIWFGGYHLLKTGDWLVRKIAVLMKKTFY